MNTKPKAFLFDFDGTLANTMIYHFLAWKKTMFDVGINISEEDYYPLEGMKLIKVAEILCNKYNKKLNNYEELVKNKIKYFNRGGGKFELYPGVKNFLNLLEQNNILKGIVSAGTPDQLIKAAGSDFMNKFNAIVNGDSTTRGKPFPDPYLEGLKKLDVNAHECIAVENAPLGIVSAKKAGIYCVAICSTTTRKHLKEADLILQRFNELKDYFKFKNVKS